MQQKPPEGIRFQTHFGEANVDQPKCLKCGGRHFNISYCLEYVRPLTVGNAKALMLASLHQVLMSGSFISHDINKTGKDFPVIRLRCENPECHEVFDFERWLEWLKSQKGDNESKEPMSVEASKIIL